MKIFENILFQLKIRLRTRLVQIGWVRKAHRDLAVIRSRVYRLCLRAYQMTIQGWLVVVFFTIMTPIAVFRRFWAPWRLPPPESQRGWRKISQRSSDRDLFTSQF